MVAAYEAAMRELHLTAHSPGAVTLSPVSAVPIRIAGENADVTAIQVAGHEPPGKVRHL